MNYYKLGVNPESKKWKGYMNPSSFLLDGEGNELSDVKLSAVQKEFNGDLYFNILKEGKAPPVFSIGSRFLAFNESIFCADNLDVNGVQLIPLINRDSNLKYILMHVFNYIDCVDWEHSKVDRWPVDYIPEIWESTHGRFFIEPVAYKSKIPENLDAFRLYEWGGAFNIVISESFKEKLLSVKFDNTLLDFKPLSLK
ncbi:hypothetical protein QNC52_004504 [Salmonella enterica]|nr:hypothetical protein [Salmonella enterica subsp. enterica]EFV1553298.1 hypothetical protein [Salmonella enterica]EIF6085777.1 hypothetical protein [Salmonella enterica]EIF8787534.1 hypothetical protein [Salmonella enterica]EJM7988671.1 hypothetical protein [Salmonella enterica]